MSKFIRCNKCGCVIFNGYFAEGMLWVPDNEHDTHRERRANLDLCMQCYKDILQPYVEEHETMGIPNLESEERS